MQFSVLDYLLTAVFTAELLLRAIVAPGFCHVPAHLKRRNANKDYRLKPFFHDPLIYFDIVSVLPTYLELLLLQSNSVTSYGTTNSIVNAFKVLRVCRLFKTLRSFSGTKVIFKTARGSCGPLSETFTPIVIGVFILGGCFLVVTNPCNGVVGTAHCEIADLWSAGYFIIITLTTTGYGDMVPLGDLSRSLVVIFMMCGTLLLAVPLSIIGNKFADAFDKKIPIKKRRGVGNFGFRTPLVDLESEHERQQRMLNSAMMMYARILGLERRMLDDEETPNQKTHDLMLLTSLHKDIAQDTVSHMPIIERHFKSLGDLGLQLVNKVTVTRVQMLPKVQPVSDKTCSEDEAAASVVPPKPAIPARKRLPKRLGSFRVRYLVNCCSQEPGRRVLRAEDSETEASEGLEALRSEARRSSSWRDKIWLILTHARENKGAFMVYVVRSLLVLSAIVVCGFETLNMMNFYGSSTVLCQDVVDQYCAKVASLDSNWRYTLPSQYAMNFPEYENITRDEFIRINNFCFPDVCDYNQTAAAHNCSDPSSIVAYVPKTSCLAPHPQSSNLTKCGFSLKQHVSLASFCSYRSISVSGQHYRLDASAMAQELVGDVPVCQRLACQDNSARRSLGEFGETNTYTVMAGIELFFAIAFCLEFTLRLATMRSPKRWV